MSEHTGRIKKALHTSLADHAHVPVYDEAMVHSDLKIDPMDLFDIISFVEDEIGASLDADEITSQLGDDYTVAQLHGAIRTAVSHA